MTNNISEKSNPKQGGSYGLLSMIGIIIGTVIGSGIFIKNQSLMEGSNSVILTFIAWLIGGLVVVCVMLSFIEISSITKIKKEQGTFTNWSRHLWGQKTSKFIGVYFTLIYFPLILASEAIYASQKLIEVSAIDNALNDKTYLIWFIITSFSLFIIFCSFYINIISIKPGKAFTSTISIVKLIPLFTVIFVALIVVGGIKVGNVSGPNEIFNPDNELTNGGLQEGGFGDSLLKILIILPGVLFAFDGFLYANSLSNETKSPNTFKRAVIISIVIITLIYILFSLSTFLVAPLGEDNSYEISTILASLFPGAPIIGDLLIFAIFLSITSSTFGYAISSQWVLSDFSEANILRDLDGKMIRRNNVGNPYRAGWTMFFMSLTAISFFRISDLMTIGWIDVALNGASIGTTEMTNYGSDLFTVINFAIYAIIIVGALKNRFSEKQEVEKVKGFNVFAVIAIFITTIVSTWMGYDILFNSMLIPIFSNSGEGITEELIISLSKLIVFVTLVSTYVIVLLIVVKEDSKVTDKEWEQKNVYRYAYENHVKYKDFKDFLPNDSENKDYTKAYQEIKRLFLEKSKNDDDEIKQQKNNKKDDT